MKKLLLATLFVLLVFDISAQQVTNASFTQKGKQVEITYTLDRKADIEVFVSTDGGKTYGNALRAVKGDVGAEVAPGSKRLIWSPLEEGDGIVSDNVVFKIVPDGGGIRVFTINGVTFKMVRVDGGSFTMGCDSEQDSECIDKEQPAHEVALQTFYIGQTEVTQALWYAVMGTDIAQQRDKANSNWHLYGEGDNYPMYYVSWQDCQDFIFRLNQLTGKRFVLPTEAQWEYAARGGNKSKNYIYSGSKNIDNVAWYDGNKVHSVASKFPNELGIYDMSGNLWEWCADWYGVYSAESQSEPYGPATGGLRVYRGGSSWSPANNCRVTYRGSYMPQNRYYILGFRLALLP